MSTANKNYPLINETDSNGHPLNAYDQLVTESNNFRRAVDTDINEVENKVSSLEQYAMTDSGSNENGTYIRFSDGTQICWTRTTINNPFETYGSSSWEDINRTDNETWSFPSSFNATPIVSGAGELLGANAGQRRGSIVGFDGVTSTFARYQLFQIGNEKFTGTAYISLIAIGRWK